jgi:hypothetical protein
VFTLPKLPESNPVDPQGRPALSRTLAKPLGQKTFKQMTKQIIWQSTLTCPVCGYRKTETMPRDACQWFYECQGCHALLKPKPGDCCVFCSYGSVACPSVQLSDGQDGCCR